ncbi:hypothetical protein CRYUN_Cryun12cG0121800 [Craigia yunnanensis]
MCLFQKKNITTSSKQLENDVVPPKRLPIRNPKPIDKICKAPEVGFLSLSHSS